MNRIVAAILISVSIIVLSAAIPALAEESLPAGNNCTEGEVIDSSTAAEAKARIEAAGYTDVQIQEKGCDNFWHATAVKNGVPGNVVLSPAGVILPEGN